MDGVVQKELEHSLGAAFTPYRAHLSPKENGEAADELNEVEDLVKEMVKNRAQRRTDFKSEVESDIS